MPEKAGKRKGKQKDNKSVEDIVNGKWRNTEAIQSALCNAPGGSRLHVVNRVNTPIPTNPAFRAVIHNIDGLPPISSTDVRNADSSSLESLVGAQLAALINNNKYY